MTRLLYIITLPLRIWHRHGFDVQSPWAYELVCDVLFEQLPYYAYETLKTVRESFPKEERKCSQEADERLFRIANHFAPANIIEIGSKLSACYLACPHKYTPIYIIKETEDSSRLDELKKTLEEVGKVGLLHIASLSCHPERNAVESKELTAQEIYNTAINHVAPNSIFVIDGIRKENRHLWQTIVHNDSRAIVTFDLGYCGIVTFDPRRVKQNYLL